MRSLLFPTPCPREPSSGKHHYATVTSHCPGDGERAASSAYSSSRGCTCGDDRKAAISLSIRWSPAGAGVRGSWAARGCDTSRRAGGRRGGASSRTVLVFLSPGLRTVTTRPDGELLGGDAGFGEPEWRGAPRAALTSWRGGGFLPPLGDRREVPLGAAPAGRRVESVDRTDSTELRE